MNWFVAPKTQELSGKALLTQKLANVSARLNGCRSVHDLWRADMLICKSELENISTEFRFDLGASGVSKIAASVTAISTAIRKVGADMPKAMSFVRAAANNISTVSSELNGVDPSEAETLELGMDDWAQQLAEARAQMPAGIDWRLD